MTYLILLTIIWVCLVGEFSVANLVAGLVISSIILLISSRALGINYLQMNWNVNVIKRIGIVLYFIGFFLKELVVASLTVFRSVVSPFSFLRPGIIAVPLDLKTSAEITLLANLITLTPGTLSLDVSTDRKVLYVHTIRMDDPETFRLSIKNGFEKRVMEVMRS